MKSTGLFIVGIIFCGTAFMGTGCICENALTQMTSQACEDEGHANVDALRVCRNDCAGDETCEADCSLVLLNAIPSCMPGAEQLFSEQQGECGDCSIQCGTDFDDCINEIPATLPVQCWDDMVDCAATCLNG